eukprot:TRINITY_DN3135_c0_g4_i1.p1 TRINITY_DN3135_c0_g4~~TRINITY_DN3135_c0_g4_i1.p1  ORF type:complete len:120 (+),score=6.96 TRINITY_DN3135_c0_g4_i1:45-404(+)
MCIRDRCYLLVHQNNPIRIWASTVINRLPKLSLGISISIGPVLRFCEQLLAKKTPAKARFITWDQTAIVKGLCTLLNHIDVDVIKNEILSNFVSVLDRLLQSVLDIETCLLYTSDAADE